MSRTLRAGVLGALLVAALATTQAADLRVDLSKETVGRTPTTFEPMVGTWVVAKDGADTVIMVDGRPWVASKDRPPVTGRVGLWSKTDSTSYFKDFVVSPK